MISPRTSRPATIATGIIHIKLLSPPPSLDAHPSDNNYELPWLLSALTQVVLNMQWLQHILIIDGDIKRIETVAIISERTTACIITCNKKWPTVYIISSSFSNHLFGNCYFDWS